jgi:predicted RNA-binding Zn-ribbon protein involved in translation (DUF1610 family)
MPLISCPECRNQVSSAAAQCPQCGYPLTKARSQLSDNLPARVTQANYVKPTLEEKMGMGAAGCGCMGLTGICLLLIPVVGWILGPLAIMAALWFPVQAMLFTKEESMANWQGSCPYCNAPITVPCGNKNTECDECKLKIIIRDKKFCTLAAARENT